MLSLLNTKKPVLKRRNSITNVLQATLDGGAVILIALALVNFNIGGLTADYVIFLLMLIGTLAVVYDRFAIYRTNVSYTYKLIALAKGWSITFMLLLLLAFLSKSSEMYSRVFLAELFLSGFAAQALLHLLVRSLQKQMIKSAEYSERVIIVGEGSLANYLNIKIKNNPWMGQQVVGGVSFSAQHLAGVEVKLSENSPRYLGDVRQIIELIDEYDISAVYIVTPMDASKLLEPIYFSLLDRHVAVHWIPDIFSLRLINHSVKEIAGVPVLTLSETPLVGMPLALKYIEDLILGSLLLVLLSPLFLIVALMIKLDSPGPVFFKQARTGWSGKVFEIWKFRSMHTHVASEGKLEQAKKNDTRITKVGEVLRRTSIDELPQLFNVVLGQMSLVGPRPHATQHDDEYSKQITHYFARHNIKPGITGLAQVRGLRGETKDIEEMMLRVESDIEYINNWSLWLDFLILLRTFSAFKGENAY